MLCTDHVNKQLPKRKHQRVLVDVEDNKHAPVSLCYNFFPFISFLNGGLTYKDIKAFRTFMSVYSSQFLR